MTKIEQHRLSFLLSGFTLLVLLSVNMVVPTFAAPPSEAMLQPSQVGTHGPLINTLVLQTMSDKDALLSVTSGQIQAMEWTLTPADYATALTTSDVYANSTPTYTFDGIAFNCLQPPYNSIYFRRAIACLTDYASLQNTLGTAVAANPALYYAPLYSIAPALHYPYPFNTTAAMEELLQVPGMTYDSHTGVWEYNGTLFSPTLLYRSDDPPRTQSALQLVSDAQKINLTITAKGISGHTASSLVYSPSEAAVINTGVMGSDLSTVTPPEFNYTYASKSDTWGMYTFGWVVSWEADWPWSFFNSQFAGSSDFGNFYNSSMDYWTNVLYYRATNTSIVQTAAYQVQNVFNQQLPYILWFYTADMYAVCTKGWTGFAEIPTTGPTESTGLFYTSLNVHPTNATGGTFIEALHQAPSSLNPLYVTNWVWQIDLWQEVYDTPIETPTPTAVTSGGIMPWMANYSIQNEVTVPIGNTSGWWSPFGAKKITDGQILTLDFWANDTWHDGIPLNAYDYNFSLYYWNLQYLTSAATPIAGSSNLPYGLLATYIPPSNPHEIQLYVNSTNLWNLYTLNINVIPMHIFKYFSPSAVATATSAMDITTPLSQISGLSSYVNANATLPTFLYWLPNLEVGSGPFVFKSWDKVSNVMTLTRNAHYYRTAWWAFNSTIFQDRPYNFSTAVKLEIYNPTSSSFQGVAAGQTGSIGITNATGTVSIVSTNGTVIGTYPLQNAGGGNYTAQIPTSSLTPGMYEIATNATYTAFGQPREDLEFSGLNVLIPPDFTVSLSSNVATIQAGSSSSVTLTVQPLQSYTGDTSLSISGQPSGVTATFSQNPVSPTQTSTLDISVSSSVSPGSYTLTISGTSPTGIVHTQALALTVTAPPFPIGYAVAVVIVVIAIVAIALYLVRSRKK